ncbi:MAG: DUF2786 domain-containing protein [Acidiphilium sp.]|nr:DUF2786 domain-containing protein [Acidiphilium sp.]MDD4937281.1 DUF2786 domain-containing protein [Acidiphilium sp.]
MPIRTATTPASTLRDRIEHFFVAASDFIARDRGESTMQKWIPRKPDETMTETRMLAMMADAVLLAADLLVAQPSLTGTTAIDRLARRLGKLSAVDAAAMTALSQARFGLFSVLAFESSGDARLQDIMGGGLLAIERPDMPPIPTATALFARLVPTGERTGFLLGAITPLDPAALAVARSHPTAGAKSIAANARWAEAVYAHVVRHGTLDIPGLNRPSGDSFDDDEFPEIDPALLDLVDDWVALDGKAPDRDLLRETRRMAEMPMILQSLQIGVLTRRADNDLKADGLERVIAVLLETIQLRASHSTGGFSLETIAAAIDHEIAQKTLPPEARALFNRLRPRQTATPMGGDPALDRLVQRIQGLRAKTVEQGCTEQEALAAAEKVAELLDRYGLSLSELEFQAQPCEGIGIQTDRRRMGPIDDCIPGIAAFFECRVWAERPHNAGFRYIFFGLRADVNAAQYLYELVERAFATETDGFRRSDLYRKMEGDRRSATNSFQYGLSRGITAKLRSLRATRDAVNRSASGRDLVPVKAAVVEDELAKLGLNLKTRTASRGKRVLSDAYAAGQEAGERFEIVSAIATTS